jgi:hypothetical protein
MAAAGLESPVDRLVPICWAELDLLLEGRLWLTAP